MKKFVLIMIFALILFLLIGSNYLLWDRENKQGDIETLRYANDSNSDYIDFLKSQIKNLEQENKSFRTNITYLEENMSGKDDELDKLQLDKESLSQTILEYKEDLVMLAEQVDFEVLKNILYQWVEYINKNDAKGAYNVFKPDMEKDGISFRDFSLAVAGIETIEIISVEKLESNEVQQQEPGVTMLAVLLSIARKEEEKNPGNIFDSGKVEIILEMGFIREERRWCIMSLEQKIVQSPSPGNTPSPTAGNSN